MNKNLKLMKAIFNLQQEVGLVVQKRTNEFGKFKYTDLTDVVLAIKPIMQKYNLGFISQMHENNAISTTIFEIESGEELTTSFVIDTDVQLKGMNKFQVIGSAISYIKKYQLISLLGLVTDEKSIDELNNERQPKAKKTLSEADFKRALESIAKGTYKTEDLLKSFDLTDSQKSEL